MKIDLKVPDVLKIQTMKINDYIKSDDEEEWVEHQK